VIDVDRLAGWMDGEVSGRQVDDIDYDVVLAR
jgi:hypothetical protein